MSEELLSLKWNNHQSHFVDILTFLREQEIFIDVTLACGGKLYPAHKFVLSTCSDYFKQMFTKNPNKHPIVFMKDVSCRDLEALLDFMYNGEVNVPQSCLGSLIKTAEGLQIKGLAVPDDPPSNLPSKRESVSSSIRDRKSSMVRDNSYSSPSPKRLRAREKSPPVSQFTSNSTPFASSARSSHSPSQIGVGDEDSRTSAHSEHSSPNNNNNNSSSSKPNVNNSHFPNDDGAAATAAVAAAAAAAGLLLPESLNRDPSPGPSGLHKPQSKEEELEIKQEDVVDLGENEETDWRGLEDSGKEEAVDEGGGGDPLTSENNPNFADVLGPSSDGALNTSGDPAMGLTASAAVVGGPLVSPHHPLTPHHPDFSIRPMVVVMDNEGRRPHPCAFCGRCFKRKDHRAEHERIHTGERPFVCVACGRAFIQKHQLVSHMKRKHKGRYAPAEGVPGPSLMVGRAQSTMTLGSGIGGQG